jgi:peptidoglycan hydrolase-like protein with peptidoglycan-binding domain
MQNNRKLLQLVCATLLLGGLALISVPSGGLAQTPSASSASINLNEATIKALQQALISQGIPITATGVLNDETRAAVRKYQTQHHLPVTGDPDKATLDKLGVRVSAAPAEQTTAQAASPAEAGARPPQGGGMMMQGQMQTGQMPGGSMQPGQMMPGGMSR